MTTIEPITQRHTGVPDPHNPGVVPPWLHPETPRILPAHIRGGDEPTPPQNPNAQPTEWWA